MTKTISKILFLSAMTATLAFPTASLAWDYHGHRHHDHVYSGHYYHGGGHYDYHPSGHWDAHGDHYDYHDTGHHDYHW